MLQSVEKINESFELLHDLEHKISVIRLLGVPDIAFDNVLAYITFQRSIENNLNKNFDFIYKNNECKKLPLFDNLDKINNTAKQEAAATLQAIRSNIRKQSQNISNTFVHDIYMLLKHQTKEIFTLLSQNVADVGQIHDPDRVSLEFKEVNALAKNYLDYSQTNSIKEIFENIAKYLEATKMFQRQGFDSISRKMKGEKSCIIM